MYTVTHIYEADFGCEERADGAKAKCVVYLEDENGRQRHVEVEDEAEYDIVIDGADAGRMKTNLGGKLSLSVELGDAPVKVSVQKC